MPLRIGVNALYLIPGGVGGTEIYLRSLLRALARVDAENEYFVFTNRETGPELAQPFHYCPQAVRGANRPARILWEQCVLPWAARRADVLFNPGFTAPLLYPRAQVTVFHDLQHKRHPEHFRRFDLPFWRALLWAAARRSRKLIAVSEATAADLKRYYGLPATVVPHGVDEAFFRLPRRQASPYLLCVSTLHPHKNLDRLLRAFAEFRRRRPEYKLTIAGMRGFAAEKLAVLGTELGLEGAVEFTGWIERPALYQLYAGADAFIYPSTFEGFGMPVLEAMAAALPTACSNIEPLASIAADAALTFDPASDGAIADAMERITGDQELRRRLAAAGPARARQFSWDEAARKTLAVIRAAV